MNITVARFLLENNVYKDCGMVRIPTVYYDQIMDALKEQEPRIITLEDFENNQKLDDSGHLNVWEEYRDGSRSGWNTINVNDVSCFSDIRRYWTDRPTEEQRKAVPWQ